MNPRIGKEAREKRKKRKPNHPTFDLVSVPITNHARARSPPMRPVVFAKGGAFAQHHNLSSRKANDDLELNPEQSPRMKAHQSNADLPDEHGWNTGYATSFETTDFSTAGSSRHRRRRASQWATWNNEIIPKLIGPYMSLMAQTSSLRNLPQSQRLICQCNRENAQVLRIKVIRFFGLSFVIDMPLTYPISVIEEIEIYKCQCRQAAVQLITLDLFPCAPLAPTLAVDIRMLDFFCRLFLRISLNHTAIAHTLEDCLGAQGYKLETNVSY